MSDESLMFVQDIQNRLFEEVDLMVIDCFYLIFVNNRNDIMTGNKTIALLVSNICTSVHF